MAVLTAANQLTLLRLLLVPVFALCMLYGLPGWALVTFVVAGATDALDGLIARRTGQQTTLGAWLDPMADKLLLATMFVMLTLPGLGLPNRLPLWLTVAVISRDIAIVLTVAVVNLAVARRTFRPSLLGKAATVIYVVVGRRRRCTATIRGSTLRIVDWCVYVSLAVTLASACQYAVHITRGFVHRRRLSEPSLEQPLRPMFIFSRKYAIVDVSPSSSCTFGSQPSSVRARVMSGWRTFGSSVGSGWKTSWLFEPVILMMSARHVLDRHLVRIADVDRVVRRSTPSA